MSSVNPVVVTELAARRRGASLGALLGQAVVGSVGQLCTKPGLVFVPRAGAAELVAGIRDAMTAAGPQRMLSGPIAARFAEGLDGWRGGVRFELDGVLDADAAAPSLAAVSIADLRPSLTHELFGPAAIIVWYDALDQVTDAIEALGGQLTVSLHFEPEDRAALTALVQTATRQAGRVLAAGVPTGVRVGWATTHGGPYPATTAAGTTSVGAAAIAPWMRPVTWQDVPEWMLPDELRDEPETPLPRRIDGRLSARP
ncbi:hypothetical protein ABGB16_06880 [Micromonospora sp. B11E3]|uniref:hypothetical protein n=1 Tax=Micromonospora sp. B11E3 TaxID=3153562 RepID=UPI00325DE7F7